MAQLQIIKNEIDLTSELITNKYDKAICDGLIELFTENKNVFDKFSGVFTIQLSFDKIFYSYLGQDANLESLKGPRRLIDSFIHQTNLNLFLGTL